MNLSWNILSEKNGNKKNNATTKNAQVKIILWIPIDEISRYYIAFHQTFFKIIFFF